ncbi:hypothetical protein CLPU_6c00310 [Gottschalkia purinilytica]|uniref:Uncharacterized protein n=1 Tax=Gottschalkia purinilytica TaxID=1503 RepID=A0A0L0WB43_GOTPU|nr:DUF6148 family protein [Gottschalkia purinilytica]KNF08545.1 hypothetical protein CLPU_6c00310 [Gottschalkia purinilytica]
MSIITKERVREHLEAWLNAELAVTTGQSYSIGSRQLTRANISEIRKQIDYWENRLKALELQDQGKKTSKRRIVGIIPRDF